MIWLFWIVIYSVFALVGNLAWYSNQASSRFDNPRFIDDLLEVWDDIRTGGVSNPVTIIFAISYIFLCNLPSLLIHTLFWWAIIPYRLIR